MPKARVELARSFKLRQILSLVRLPIPPLSRSHVHASRRATTPYYPARPGEGRQDGPAHGTERATRSTAAAVRPQRCSARHAPRNGPPSPRAGAGTPPARSRPSRHPPPARGAGDQTPGAVELRVMPRTSPALPPVAGSQHRKTETRGAGFQPLPAPDVRTAGESQHPTEKLSKPVSETAARPRQRGARRPPRQSPA